VTQQTDSDSRQVFVGQADQIASACRFVRHALAASGVTHRIPDGVLMASELVTNAVVHGHGAVEVSVGVFAHDVRVGVASASTDAGRPHPVRPAPRDVSGRGLGIVDQLAARWGTERTRDGRTSVWFALPAG
jgi:anti-sigma regulatory factor (Ser/Thr protein kinase)